MPDLSSHITEVRDDLKDLFLFSKKKPIFDKFRNAAKLAGMDPWVYVLKVAYDTGLAERKVKPEKGNFDKTLSAMKRINAAQKRKSNAWITNAARFMVITKWPADTKRDANINLDFIHAVYEGATEVDQIFDRGVSMWELLYRHFKVWLQKNSIGLTDAQYAEIFKKEDPRAGY